MSGRYAVYEQRIAAAHRWGFVVVVAVCVFVLPWAAGFIARLWSPAANRQFVLWPSGRRTLSGMLLPSLRRFVIPLPAGLGLGGIHGTLPGVELSQDLLYVDGRNSFVATLPNER